jgi:hypothetical protein
MPRFPKFGVLEIDGEELGQPSEYEPVSEDIYYDIGKEDTVKGKIDTIALGYGVFFKYELNQDLSIPSGRSLVVGDTIDIGDYCLEIDGTGIFEVI